MNQSIKQRIKEFIKKRDYGEFGNGILYDMCKQFPFHRNDSEIIGKVWLIGRAYAASIERNRNRKKKVSDDFFREEVTPIFRNGNAFDNLLKDARPLKKLDDKCIDIVLKTHKDVTRFIRRITGDDKRSFISKYLHFHFPNLFFIYDSRVGSIISSVIKEIERSGYKKFQYIKSKDTDGTYASFFRKCYYFRKFCKQNSISITPRQTDSFLIEQANQKVR